MKRKQGKYNSYHKNSAKVEKTRGGVLGISSDGDDRRIFWGLKFSIPGFFWVGKIGQVFFGVA